MLQDSDHLKLIDFGFAKWGDLILGTAALESTLALAVNQPLLIPRQFGLFVSFQGERAQSASKGGRKDTALHAKETSCPGDLSCFGPIEVIALEAISSFFVGHLRRVFPYRKLTPVSLTLASRLDVSAMLCPPFLHAS